MLLEFLILAAVNCPLLLFCIRSEFCSALLQEGGSESLKKFEVSAQSQETLYLTFPKIARDLGSSESNKKSKNRKHSALQIGMLSLLYFVLFPLAFGPFDF